MLKVAIVRGNTMNRFEMQSYEPLASAYELTGYASHIGMFELDNITFPIKRLHSAEEYYLRLPPPFRGLAYGLTLRRGMNNKLYGLEKELEDKDIIHAMETYNGYCYQSARAKQGTKKKLVLTVWENIPFLSTKLFRGWDGFPSPVRGALGSLTKNDGIVKYIKERTDLYIAVTERAKQALMVEGVPEERIRVIPAGVDTNKFRPADRDLGLRKQLNVEEDDIVALCIGRLTVEKGIYELLYAVRLLYADPALRRVKIVLVGGGPEKENVARLIKRLGIDDNVKIAGGFSYEYIPKLYNAADFFILPSVPMTWWQEQFGMVLVEAMASGLPVISTASGSIPEVVGDSGILMQPADPLSICSAIRTMASDEAVRKKYARMGRDRALEKFDTRVVAKQIEMTYKELS